MKYLNANMELIEFVPCCARMEETYKLHHIYAEVGGELALDAGIIGSYFIYYCPFCGHDFDIKGE